MVQTLFGSRPQAHYEQKTLGRIIEREGEKQKQGSELKTAKVSVLSHIDPKLFSTQAATVTGGLF